MKVPGFVQRLIPGESGLPKCEHLAQTVNGWEWQSSAVGAFVFPDYDSFGSCSAPDCETHAACAAKHLGGYPVVSSRGAAPVHTPNHEPESSAPRRASQLTEAMEDLRAHHARRVPPSPSEVYEREEKRGR